MINGPSWLSMTQLGPCKECYRGKVRLLYIYIAVSYVCMFLPPEGKLKGFEYIAAAEEWPQEVPRVAHPRARRRQRQRVSQQQQHSQTAYGTKYSS